MSSIKDNGVITETASTQESEFVSKKAYEDVSKDMHKYKSETKELRAGLNELQSMLKAQEEQKLAEANNYKTLWEKQKAELEEQKARSAQQESKFVKSLKAIELKKELGANINDAYLIHANVDAIEFNEDGTVNRETLVTVANSFRQQHGALIPKSENVNITGHAATSGVVTPTKPISQMSKDELVAEYLKVKQSK